VTYDDLFSKASAFLPSIARPSVGIRQLKMADELVGVSVEAGGKVNDPFDLLSLHKIAPSVFPHAQWLRESELKHSRAAMLASVGIKHRFFAYEIDAKGNYIRRIFSPVGTCNSRLHSRA